MENLLENKIVKQPLFDKPGQPVIGHYKFRLFDDSLSRTFGRSTHHSPRQQLTRKKKHPSHRRRKSASQRNFISESFAMRPNVEQFAIIIKHFFINVYNVFSLSVP
jgi:hypothetical protein